MSLPQCTIGNCQIKKYT